MGGMPIASLPSRSVLRLEGDDTLAFLQGLVTNDVMRLKAERAQYAALLTPQGKFLYGFFLYALGNAVLIDVDGARAAELLQRLKMYRLRSKVEIDFLPEMKVFAGWDAPAPEGAYADPRLAELGWRVVSEGMQTDATAQAYAQMRLSLSVPDESVDLVPEKSFPLHFGFEDLHAVDFRKGCYVGQEVTARTKHLGTMRKFLYRVEGAGSLPPAGSAIMAGSDVAGEMCSSEGGVGLAILQAEKASGALSYAGGALSASLPNWARNIPAA